MPALGQMTGSEYWSGWQLPCTLHWKHLSFGVCVCVLSCEPYPGAMHLLIQPRHLKAHQSTSLVATRNLKNSDKWCCDYHSGDLKSTLCSLRNLGHLSD